MTTVWRRMFRYSAQVAMLLAWIVSAAAAEPANPRLEHRWVYLATNLLVDEKVEESLTMLARAAAAGYNGVVVTDSKFLRWNDLGENYTANVRRFREGCRRLKLDCIACVFPIGYSGDLLAHNPNLAEGLPVKQAAFRATEGRLVAELGPTRLVNGGFEQHQGDRPTGWTFVDQPGKIAFIDTRVRREGRAALRMQDIGKYDPENGHGRCCQKLTVEPFHHYHLSLAVKTEDFAAAREFRVAVLDQEGAGLNFLEPAIERTQDWRRIDITFNSLDASSVNLYLGVWGGTTGRIWLDDVQLEAAGLLNVVRRAGAPLALASADGRTIYVEGRDFAGAKDPKLGANPWPGEFSPWHEPPNLTLPHGSAIRDGQTVRMSYYHTALIHDEQAMCCLAEPEVCQILRWQAAQVHRQLQPDGYFMQHDEIRLQGWDESCRRSGKRPGELLADNVRQCTEILQAEDPGKPIYVWSDMFDPFHNAAEHGRYYLVAGDGPWYGSWEGLSPEVTIVDWNGGPRTRADSLRHFAARGHRQILAGYYDGAPAELDGWLRDAAPIAGVDGVMYTTWRHAYDDLEAFSRRLPPPPATPKR